MISAIEPIITWFNEIIKVMILLNLPEDALLYKTKWRKMICVTEPEYFIRNKIQHAIALDNKVLFINSQVGENICILAEWKGIIWSWEPYRHDKQSKQSNPHRIFSG